MILSGTPGSQEVNQHMNIFTKGIKGALASDILLLEGIMLYIYQVSKSVYICLL